MHVPHHTKVMNLRKISLNKVRKSLDQTLALIGVYNCPGIFSKGHMAGQKQLREIFGGCRDNLLILVQDGPTRCDAKLDL